MSKARGDLCIMACGDDVFFENRVAEFVEAHEKSGATVITSNAEYIDVQGNSLGLFRDPKANYDLSIDEFLRESWIVTCFGAGMGWHRSLFDYFGPIKPGPRNWDRVIPFRGVLYGGNYYIKEPLLQWRQHRGNTSINRVMENAQTNLERLQVTERDLNNHVANWVIMFNELGFHIRKSEDANLQKHLNRIGMCIVNTASEWVVARDTLVRAGHGVA